MKIGKLDKSNIVIIILFVVGIFFAIWASYFTIRNSNLSLPFFGEDILIDEEGEPTEEFFKAAEEKTFDELKEDLDNFHLSPSMSLESDREALEKSTKNTKPINNVNIITEEGLANTKMLVKRGDYVTWRNTTDKDLIIKNDWYGNIPFELKVLAGKQKTQQFDFIGEYEYQIVGLEDVYGVIIVPKPK